MSDSNIAEIKRQLERATSAIRLLRELLEKSEEGLGSSEIQVFGMEIAVKVTDSEGGYLHFFDENENVIDLATWSQSVMQICDAEAAMHYPIELAGIWADCARERKTVVHNDYQSIPDSMKGGLPDGHFPLYRHMSVPVFDHGKLVAIVGVGNKKEPYDEHDIQQMELLMSCLWSVLQKERAQEILQRYSYEDGVTGIANRRKFNEVIESEWARMRRKGFPLNLIMIDIDFFKGFNDHYGHAQGDICLKKVAQSLQRSFRRTGELVTRYGGEEFAVIIPYASIEEAITSAELARKEIEECYIDYPLSEVSNYVTVSMGVAQMVPEGDDFSVLLQAADRYLYQAKAAGRNRIAYA